MHAFLTRDGIPPEYFRRLALDELKRYRNVGYWQGEVSETAIRRDGSFVVRLGLRRVRARKVLIATGVHDQMPPIEGFREPLADRLGSIDRRGAIKSGQYEATSVPGVFVAANLIKNVQLSIVAAAEGTRAAFGINRALTREDFERNVTGRKRIEHP